MKKKFDYTWVIVTLCFLMIFGALGFAMSNRSLYLAPITEALGIKRSAFSLTDTFRNITMSVVSLCFSALILKLGEKRLIIIGLAGLIASVLMYAVATDIMLFYVGSILSGMGACLTGTTMAGSVVNRWCRKNQGTIMGIVLAGNGIGGAIAVQIVTPIIYEEGNPFGYRNAYFVVAGVLIVITLLILLFFRENTPENIWHGREPEKKQNSRQRWIGISFDEALRKPYFYRIAACLFLNGFILQGVYGVISAHMNDAGIDSAYVATVLSVLSVGMMGFNFLSGFMYDRLGLRVTMTVCYVAAVATFFCLLGLRDSGMGRVLAMMSGVLLSLALPMETILIPICVGDLFGQKNYHKLLGVLMAINTMGCACGTPVMNLFYDVTGSYRFALIFGGAVMLILTVVLQMTITASKQVRRESYEIVD